MRRAVLPRRLDLSGGEAGGEAGGERTVIATEGGVSHKQRGGYHIPLVHISPSLFGFFVLDRRS